MYRECDEWKKRCVSFNYTAEMAEANITVWSELVTETSTFEKWGEQQTSKKPSNSSRKEQFKN
jgi:hypothetical protein